jgi:hypothetical protein
MRGVDRGTGVAMAPGTWFWVIGVVVLVAGLGIGWPRRRGRNGLRVLAGLLLLAIAAGAMFSGFALRPYQWVRADAPIAQVALRQLAVQSFEATLTGPGREPAVLPLHGDEWQVGVRVLRWELPPGPRPMAGLERLSGRHGDPKQEAATPGDVHDLRAHPDFWTVRQRWLAPFPVADAQWGSTEAMPMLDGTRFDVFVDAHGGLRVEAADEDSRRLLRAAGW